MSTATAPAPTAADPTPTPVPDETEPAAEPIDLTFDFTESHCSYYPDELLHDVDAWIVTLLTDRERSKSLENLSDYDWNEHADHLDTLAGDLDRIPGHLRPADVEDDDLAETLEEVALTIRDFLHGYECDCSITDFEWFTEHVDEVFATQLERHPRAKVVVYHGSFAEDPPTIAGSDLTLGTLSEKFAGRGYDAVKVKLDPTTGEGSIRYGDRGWGSDHDIVFVTDEVMLDVLEAFLDQGGHYENDYLVRELRDVAVSKELADLVRALGETKIEARVADHGAYDLDELGPQDFHTALKQAGVLTLAPFDLVTATQLAPTWEGTLDDLVAVLHATAA